MMEKYAVVIEGQKDLFKEAAKDGKPICPKCGAKVRTHGSVPQCRNCGTEPYEVKSGKTEEGRDPGSDGSTGAAASTETGREV